MYMTNALTSRDFLGRFNFLGMETIPNKFFTILESLRPHGMNDSQFSRYIGVNRQYIQNWRSGKTPTTINVEKICRSAGWSDHTMRRLKEARDDDERAKAEIKAQGGSHGLTPVATLDDLHHLPDHFFVKKLTEFMSHGESMGDFFGSLEISQEELAHWAHDDASATYTRRATIFKKLKARDPRMRSAELIEWFWSGSGPLPAISKLLEERKNETRH